jgi:hypothetical protein
LEHTSYQVNWREVTNLKSLFCKCSLAQSSPKLSPYFRKAPLSMHTPTGPRHTTCAKRKLTSISKRWYIQVEPERAPMSKRWYIQLAPVTRSRHHNKNTSSCWLHHLFLPRFTGTTGKSVEANSCIHSTQGMDISPGEATDDWGNCSLESRGLGEPYAQCQEVTGAPVNSRKLSFPSTPRVHFLPTPCSQLLDSSCPYTPASKAPISVCLSSFIDATPTPGYVDGMRRRAKKTLLKS